jgi:hypothetical protein
MNKSRHCKCRPALDDFSIIPVGKSGVVEKNSIPDLFDSLKNNKLKND